MRARDYGESLQPEQVMKGRHLAQIARQVAQDYHDLLKRIEALEAAQGTLKVARDRSQERSD